LADNSSTEELNKFGNDPMKKHNRLCLLFRKFAHSSCMRLNEVSMSKLYDLMTMCLKYQIFLTRAPLELYSITLNHLDSIERMAASPKNFFENTKATLNYEKSQDHICQHIRKTKEKFIETYQNKSESDFNFIKLELNKLLKNSLTKISMFVRANIQKADGSFIYAQKTEVPLSDLKFEIINKNVVDCCYRGSTLGNSLYHLFGRKDDGTARVSGQQSSVDGKNDVRTENRTTKSTKRESEDSSANLDMINFDLGAEQMKIIKNTCLTDAGNESENSDCSLELFEDCAGMI